MTRCSRGVGVAALTASLLGCGANGGPEADEYVVGGVKDDGTTGSGSNGPGGGSAGENDAGQSDGGPQPLIPGCTFSADPVEVALDAPTRQGFATRVSGNDLEVAFLVPSCGATFGNARSFGLRLTSIPTRGSAPDARDLWNVGVDDCFVTRDPAFAGDTLTFVANPDGYAVQQFPLDAKVPRDVSKLAARVPHALASTRVGARSVTLWASGTVDDAHSDVHALWDLDGSKSARLLAQDAGHRVLAMSAAPLSRSAREGIAAVAWVSDSDEQRGIFLRTLHEDGTAGDLQPLSAQVGAASSVTVAAQDQGGAVVYVVGGEGGRGELRFRRLDEAGGVGREAKLTSGNEDVVDPAIFEFARGYVVAHRARIGGEGVVRLLFLDAAGNVAGMRELAEATATAGRIEGAVANDGRIFVTYTDVRSPDTHVARTLRVQCD